MILDGSRSSGWHQQLKSLPERVKELNGSVRFNIIERQIGDRFCARTVRVVDESAVIAYGIADADTLLGILFDESLKSKSIAAIDENYWPVSAFLYITIVLVQGSGYTNIDAGVLESFAKVLET